MPTDVLNTLESEGWVTAWHGALLQSVYSTIKWGALLPSCLPDNVDRFFKGIEGVYCYRDSQRHRTLGSSYSHYTPLDPERGGWVRVVWELRVREANRCKDKRLAQSKQWAFDPNDVVLAALWSHSVWTPDLPLHTAFVFKWWPKEEAHPDARENRLRVQVFDAIRQRRRHRECRGCPSS